MTTHTFHCALAGLGALEVVLVAYVWAICRAAARRPLPSRDDAARDHQS